MNRKEFLFGCRTLAFLDSCEGDRAGILELDDRPTPRLLVWHPEAIDWIFRTDHRLHHMGSRTLGPLLGARSLLWAVGARHSAYRQVLGPALRGHQLQAYHGIISETVHSALDELAPKSVVSAVEWTRKVALRIIGKILLGHADDQLLSSFNACTERMLDSRIRTVSQHCLRALGLPLPGRSRTHPRRRNMAEVLVRSAKNTSICRPPALATRLLAGQPPLGKLDDAELADQLMSLLFAGHETTASAAAWVLYWLGRDDKVRRDVGAELAATSHDGSDPARVPLLHAVIQETLRVCPPAIIAGKRMLTAEGELLGRRLAPGTVLTPCSYLAHHQPDVFPHPRRFDPGRFLGQQVSGRHYFPFGGGIRRCLGSELAMLEIRMMTAAILHRRELHWVHPKSGVATLRGPVLTLAKKTRMSLLPHPAAHQGAAT